MQYPTHERSSMRPVLLAALLMAAPAAAFVTTSAAAQGAPGGSSTPAASVPPQPARWTQKKLFFVYQGIQTKYTCQGLTDTMRSILLTLGARRSDMDLRQTGCIGVNTPSPNPGVSGTISVLEPVAPEQAYSPGANPGTVATRWQRVQLQLDRPGRGGQTQCELLEQVKLRILPLFTTRNVELQSTCSPRQLVVGRSRLLLDVLMPAADNRAARE